jgi:hypothetical protein
MNIPLLIDFILMWSPVIIMLPAVNYLVWAYAHWNFDKQEYE